MIVQEDIPYANEEVKATVKTIHDLREKVSQLGWHPASEKQPEMGEQIVAWVNHGDGIISVSRGAYVGWPKDIINKLQWCYPPEKED